MWKSAKKIFYVPMTLLGGLLFGTYEIYEILATGSFFLSIKMVVYILMLFLYVPCVIM